MLHREAHAAPMQPSSGWKAIWTINAAFLRSGASFALAWGTWAVRTHPGYEIFAFIAAIFALVGVKHAVIALVGVVRLILSQRRMARYRAQGATPKADRMASAADLRARGLLE